MHTTINYDIEVIKEEARQLIKKGAIDYHQPIYALCQYIPGREWVCFEIELEKNEFLLRDKIIDLIGREDWDQD
jgi:Domain of unknown function (DUF4327)